MLLVQIVQVIAAISALPEVATEAGVPVLSVGALVDRILRGAGPTAYQGFGPEPCVLADGVL